MKSCEWIVCEPTNRWAAALRVAVARAANWPAGEPRLYEVRSLEELAARLEVRPNSLGFINVHDNNVPRVLSWLAAARGLYSRARFVALIDCRLSREEIADALLEAGAAEIAYSPRYLQHVLAPPPPPPPPAAARPAASAADNSLMESIWSSLPWQPEQRPVG